ncbi:oligosaccharide flippase family protein [bacterium]|nr:oligosaccharide flippase family protein [bacterium]
MLSSIKRLTKHSAVYGIGHILSRAIGFLLLPIHTNYIVPKEYGAAALLFSSIAILTVFFSYGMDIAFLRYFVLSENRENKRLIFSTAFITLVFSGVLFSGFMLLFPVPFSKIIFDSPDFILLIRLAAGILFADTLCLVPYLVLRGEEKSKAFVMVKLFNILLNVGLNILLIVYLKQGVRGIFISNVIASFMTLLVLLPIIVKFIENRFDFHVLKQLLSFGLPYIPSGIAVLVMDQIGRFFLDRMAGKSAAGIFSANCKLGMFMALLVAAFRFAWHPFFLKTAKDEENAPEIFARVFTYFIAVTGLFFLLISLSLNEIVSFHIGSMRLFGRGFSTGMGIVPVILLSYVFYGIYINSIIGIYLKKKTKYLILITSAGAFAGILMNYILVPRWNIMGAAVATLIAYFVMAVVIYFVNKKLYPIPYESYRIIKIIAAAVISFFGGKILFVKDGMGMLIIIVFPFLLFLSGFFNKGEKAAFISFFRRSVP